MCPACGWSEGLKGGTSFSLWSPCMPSHGVSPCVSVWVCVWVDVRGRGPGRKKLGKRSLWLFYLGGKKKNSGREGGDFSGTEERVIGKSNGLNPGEFWHFSFSLRRSAVPSACQSLPQISLSWLSHHVVSHQFHVLTGANSALHRSISGCPSTSTSVLLPCFYFLHSFLLLSEIFSHKYYLLLFTCILSTDSIRRWVLWG